MNGVVAFATPDDGAGSDQGVVVTLSGVPAHTRVDANAILGHDPSGDLDGWTLTAGGETVAEARHEAGGYPSYSTTLHGTVASRGDAGGTVTIVVSIDDFQGGGWGLNGLNVSVFTPTVSIGPGGVGVNERDQSFVPITVSRDGGAVAWDEPLTVPIEWGGDATRDQDYVGTVDEVVIPAGQGSATVKVAVVDDPNYEPQETFTARISGGGPGFVVGSNGPFVTTILESDRVSGVNVEGETYTVGDVKEVKVLVTDEDGYGKGGETVTLTEFDSEVIRPQGTTATTDGDGYATFNVQGYGVGIATLIASVTQVGATQPTTGAATQTVAAVVNYRRWKSLVGNLGDVYKSVKDKIAADVLAKPLNTIDKIAEKLPGVEAGDLTKTIGDFLQKTLNSLVAQIAGNLVHFRSTTKLEKLGGSEIFADAELPSILTPIPRLELLGIEIKLAPKVSLPTLSGDKSQKSFVLDFAGTVNINPKIFGTELGSGIDFEAEQGVVVLRASDGELIKRAN